MDLGAVTNIIAALLAVIALLIVVVRWALDGRKKVSQSDECSEEHKEVMARLVAMEKELATTLANAVHGFRESHLSENMKLDLAIKELEKLDKAATDILKKLDKI
jgi:predicted negative regulator of RcsB-dependent stress response